MQEEDLEPNATPRTRSFTRRLALSGLASAAGVAVASVAAAPTASAQTATTGASSGSGASTPATGAAGTQSPSTEASTTTTLPPQRPTAADTVLLGFVQTLELAAFNLYGKAVPTIPEDQREVPAAFMLNHQGYGEQLGAMLGRRAPGVPNATLVAELTPAFGASSVPAVLRAMYDLEDSLAASLAALLGELEGTDGAALIASILPIGARQAVVLGQAIDIDDKELMPVFEGDEPGAKVLTPAQYPVV